MSGALGCDGMRRGLANTFGADASNENYEDS